VTHRMQPTAERKTFAQVLAGRLHTGAGIWLFAVIVGPCREHEPTAVPPPQHDVAAVGASAGSAAAPAPHPQATQTTRSYMLTHYADTVGMRRALVRGKLDEFHASAAAVANDEWTPRLRGDYRPQLDAVRATAHGAQLASSVVAGAALLGKLGEECASCHLKVGGPGSPIAPEQLSEGIDPSMVAHAVATDQLWEGLILSSDISWSSGMKLLLDAPKLDSDVPDVAATAVHLRDLARQGQTARVEQRARIFANVLTTCASCHERLGVNVHPTPSP
jgi:mono/diheme cytochrome c family protein